MLPRRNEKGYNAPPQTLNSRYHPVNRNCIHFAQAHSEIRARLRQPSDLRNLGLIRSELDSVTAPDFKDTARVWGCRPFGFEALRQKCVPKCQVEPDDQPLRYVRGSGRRKLAIAAFVARLRQKLSSSSPVPTRNTSEPPLQAATIITIFIHIHIYIYIHILF